MTPAEQAELTALRRRAAGQEQATPLTPAEQAELTALRRRRRETAPPVSQRPPRPRDQPAPAPGLPAAVRQVVQGLTAGWGDELEAALRAPVSADTYGDIQAGLQRQSDRFAEAHPGAALGLQVAGSLPLLLTGVGALGPAAVRTAVQRVPAAVRALAGGTTAGAVAGAGTADPDARPAGAATGALLGGAGAGVLTGAGAIAGPVWRATRDIGRPARAAGRRLERSTPPDLTTRIEQLGPDAVAADASPELRELAAAVAAKPGATVERADRLLTEREAAAVPRLRAALDEMAGSGGALGRAESSPDFARLLAQPVPFTQEMAQLLTTRPSLRLAWQRARNLAAEQGHQLPPLGKLRVLARSEATVETRVLHWVKKGLDDLLEPKRSRQSGRLETERGKNVLRAQQETRAAWRDLVREANPEYGEALDQLGLGFRARDAYQEGRERFMRMPGPDAVREAAAKWTPAERTRLREGIRDALAEQMEMAAAAGRSPRRLLAGQRPKLAAVDDQDRIGRLLEQLTAEEAFELTSRALQPALAAARRIAPGELEQQERLSRLLDIGRIGANLAAGWRPGATAMEAGIAALRRNLRLAGLSPQARDQLGEALLTPLDQGGRERLDALLQALAR